ncbi:hypothetical protein ABZ137_03690 [Streptomyces bobili]|uniref:hypothetical protein n=1 Tax=Streptomyces bobili TaxID=67280 RepID=UPI0033B05644
MSPIVTAPVSAAGAALSGAPWLVVALLALTAALADPIFKNVRGLLTERDERKTNEILRTAAEQITDPGKRIQALIQLRAASPPPEDPDPDNPPLQNSA